MENGNAQGVVRGYKVFEPDWTCRGFQYEVGKAYEMDGLPVCCERGFHFCLEAAGCFSYYKFDPGNKVAEVIALGEVDSENNNTKCCTNKIQIVREIPWDEVLRIVNIGKGCTGFRNAGDYNAGDYNAGDYNAGKCNTGHYNAGDCNTGDRNTGHYNAGDCNTGDYNAGDWNTGDNNAGRRNTGDCNTGDYNAGRRNTGDCNTGDWNKSSFNTGCFMTEEQKIPMFNKPSGWTYRDWLDSEARRLLGQMPKNTVGWVRSGDMTEEEKAGHPTHETTGGYLKRTGGSECAQLWWDSLAERQKDAIKAIPNFDPGIFMECTGIKVGG